MIYKFLLLLLLQIIIISNKCKSSKQFKVRRLLSESLIPIKVQFGDQLKTIDFPSNSNTQQLYDGIKQQFDITSYTKMQLLVNGESIIPSTSTPISDISIGSGELINVNIELNHIELLFKMFDKNDQINLFGLNEDNLRLQQTSIHQIADVLQRRLIIKYELDNDGDIKIKEISLCNYLNIDPPIKHPINWFNVPNTVEKIHIINSFDLEEMNLNGLGLNPSLKQLRIMRNKQLQRLDLSGLNGMSSLELVWINNNKLKELDLSPLTTCTSLKTLFLGDNQLEKLDLSPLTGCISLYSLRLNNNLLQTLDLSPLSESTSLIQIDLRNNKLQSLDVSPLSKCVSLTDVFVRNNPCSVSIDRSSFGSRAYCIG